MPNCPPEIVLLMTDAVGADSPAWPPIKSPIPAALDTVDEFRMMALAFRSSTPGAAVVDTTVAFEVSKPLPASMSIEFVATPMSSPSFAPLMTSKLSAGSPGATMTVSVLMVVAAVAGTASEVSAHPMAVERTRLRGCEDRHLGMTLAPCTKNHYGDNLHQLRDLLLKSHCMLRRLSGQRRERTRPRPSPSRQFVAL